MVDRSAEEEWKQRRQGPEFSKKIAKNLLHKQSDEARRQSERDSRYAAKQEQRAVVIVADDAAGPQEGFYDPVVLNGHDDVQGREALSATRHERRTLIKHSGGAYTPEQWQAVLAKYGSRCLRCGDTEDLTVDHVKPVNLGGSSDISNLQPLCRSCNSWKGTKVLDFR